MNQTPLPRENVELPPRSETPRPHNKSSANPATSRRTGRQRTLTEVLLNMEIMQHTTTVLLVSLEPTWTRRNRPNLSRNLSKDACTTFFNEFHKLQQIDGLYMEIHVLNPDSRDNVQDLKKKVRDGSGPDGGNKAWDGVLLEWCFRTDVELTMLFEEVANYIHETLPGTRLLFSSTDEDWPATLRRNLALGHENIPLTKTAPDSMHMASQRMPTSRLHE